MTYADFATGVVDPLTALLQATGAGSTASTRFAPPSRYSGIAVKQILMDGRQVNYLSRRFVPQPSQYDLREVHVVTEGDRLDNIAAQHLDNPLLFYQIADANGALRPEELTEQIGRQLRIPLPPGVPAIPMSEGL